MEILPVPVARVEAARPRINMVVPYAVVAAVAAVCLGLVLALFLTDDTLLVVFAVVFALAAVCVLVTRGEER